MIQLVHLQFHDKKVSFRQSSTSSESLISVPVLCAHAILHASAVQRVATYHINHLDREESIFVTPEQFSSTISSSNTDA